MAIFHCYVSSPEGKKDAHDVRKTPAMACPDFPGDKRRRASSIFGRASGSAGLRRMIQHGAWLRLVDTNRFAWWMFWVNYNELTASSLEIIVSKGNRPQMALIQVSELL